MEIKNYKKNIVLVGLGPHSKRMYLNFFKKYSFEPKLIVDIDSKETEIKNYLNEKGFSSKVFLIPNEFKNLPKLPKEIAEKLKLKIKELNITHAIISTEPKAHLQYLRFFLNLDINIFTDKPITAPKEVSTNKTQAKKIWYDYNELLTKYLDNGQKHQFEIQCQRRFHPGYLYAYYLLKETICKYGIPITHIRLDHCDGMWNMPNEYLERENHPYKYGYGKLFHSGYHFIDLMAWYVRLNNSIKEKKINNGDLYVTASRPSDQITIINKSNYEQLFKTDLMNSTFEKNPINNFNKFGEVDFCSLINFRHNSELITIGTINLLQNGFSRRSWIKLPKDTYKGNGRVRHQSMNIQIGPLLNIQLHSYQAREIKERGNEKDNGPGSIEHFEIFVFRNKDLIGGKEFERISVEDIMDRSKEHFFGYNETAKEVSFMNFLKNERGNSNIIDHSLSIKLLSHSYLSMCKKYNNESPIVNFKVNGGMEREL